MRFVSVGAARLESAKCNSFALIGTSSAAVDKWGVEPMYIIVLVVDEESFAHSSIALCESLHVEPKFGVSKQANLLT